jgi:GT2 family glycosyltransferase
MLADAFVSVVVPTHNRRSAVSRLLAALGDQDHPRGRMEVIVVADGCTDDTHEVLAQYRGPLSFRLIQQPNQGPAAARNAGAASAKGECLLFLDDDVVPNPRLVTAHLRVHQRSPGGVVIGPYPPAHLGAGLFNLTVQAWWRNVFEELLKVSCRQSFTSVLTGNLSLSADLFQRLGGFDTRFRAHEDYEFGMRLIKADIMIVYEPEALALHHHQSHLAAHIERKTDEGRGDVMLLERYPELVTELPLYRLMRSAAWQDRMIRALALRRLPLAGMLRRLLLSLLDLSDATGLPGAWRMLKGLLERYAYLYAVADQLGGARPVIDFCRLLGSQRLQGGARLELDLSHGIAEAERQVDLVRPSGVRVRYRSDLIGVIPWQPGAERLRGVHLRAALARELAAPFLEAMARDGAIAGDSEEQRRLLCAAVLRQRYWFGPVRLGEMWFEQYAQWQRFEGRETEGDRKTRQFWDLFTSLARELDWLDDENRQARPRAIAEDAVR